MQATVRRSAPGTRPGKTRQRPERGREEDAEAELTERIRERKIQGVDRWVARGRKNGMLSVESKPGEK